MAVRERILFPGNLVSFPGIAFSILDDIKTDLSKADIGRLLCLLPKIDEGAIRAYGIERELVTPTINEMGAYVMIPHEGEIRKFVVDFMRGDLETE